MAKTEYILRSDILYHTVEFEERCHNDRWTETHEIAYKAEIDQIPAADVIPAQHGKWVKATGMMPPEYCDLHICSECGHYAGRKPPYGGREMLSDYCPHCGARMDGE